MSKIKTICCLFIILFPALFINIDAQDFSKNSFNKITSDTVKYAKFNINNISTYIYNNGMSDHSPQGYNNFLYPKSSGVSAIFASGVLWGGLVDGEIRVGGTAYRTGLQPGKIISTGNAENPEDPSANVFRVRPDYKFANFSAEIKDGEGTAEEIRARYEFDWNNWPASKGAPFEDVDKNGVYDPAVDIPGVRGAAQTIWYVANDLNSNLTKNLYNSLPIGLELQVTVWGYKAPILDHMILKKYKLINKSGKDVEDMYLGIFSDPDLGDAGDDFAGCDTLFSLGYSYNSSPNDYQYKNQANLPPPAVGFALLEGPKVDGIPSDSAYFDGRILYGMKNQPMSAFVYYAGGDPNIGDPPQGTSGTADGYKQLYNYFRGRYSQGNSIKNLVTGNITTYMLSGDPMTKDGWLDGMQLPPGDRRIMSSTGPFQLAAADTQEVIFAQIGAGAEQNTGHLAAISYLRTYAATAKELFYNNFKSPEAPRVPAIHANSYDQTAVLTWGENVNEANIIESSVFGDYGFQGYNVYQFSSPDFSTAKSIKVATFDLIDSVSIIYDYVPDTINGGRIYTAVQKGLNSGLQRYFIFDKDYFTGHPLYNGAKYYFGVTSYFYNPKFKIFPAVIENEPNIFTLVPQKPEPGFRYGAGVNDILPVTHTKGNSRETVSPVVINPADLNGHKYKITFKDTGNDLVWDLTDISDNVKVLANQEYKRGNGIGNYVVDGFIVKITDYNFDTNTPEDEFIFSMPQNSSSESLAREDVNKVNVFPNPYYGYNANEETNYGKFVTFSHLPQKATIRIFDLAGRLIRTMEKDSPDQFYKFYLFTNANTPLGSGIYIAFIEMPELKTTKILKFAIISPQVVPDSY